MPPLVSIALITYNGARFLRQQLDSIINQSYTNVEIIAVDDGSTDSTVQLLEEYGVAYGIHLYKNGSTLGHVKNFERAVSLCSGDYIAPADQDDIWMPQKIEKLVKGIQDYHLACSDAILIDEKGVPFSTSAMAFSNFAPASGKAFIRFLFSTFVIGCSMLMSKELVKQALPIPEGERYHDWWMALIASTMKGIVYLDEPLFMYRQHHFNTIGMKKDASFYGKLFGFLYSRSERDWYAVQESRLGVLENATQFNEKQKELIRMARGFYKDRLNSGIHLKAFSIACRYQRQMFPWNKGFFRFKAVVGCLFR